MPNIHKEIEITYREIQSSLNKLIPEKWRGIYLYESIVRGRSEMFFYYFPKRIMKHNAINCYEIANKFGFDENQYNRALEILHKKIQRLSVFEKRKWTNVTITMENNVFSVEYHFNDLTKSKYSDEERHLVWCYKNLKTPLETLSKKDRILVENYVEETNIRPVVHREPLMKFKEE